MLHFQSNIYRLEGNKHYCPSTFMYRFEGCSKIKLRSS